MRGREGVVPAFSIRNDVEAARSVEIDTERPHRLQDAIIATNEDRYSGIPSGGSSELAHLRDVGSTVRLHERLVAYAYYGHAFGLW